MILTGVLARRAFLETDQQAFSKFSNDFNPIHLDPVAARRTQAGSPIVHGMHLVLWSIEVLAQQTLEFPYLQAVKARFPSFLFVGDEAELHGSQQVSDIVRLTVKSRGISVALIHLQINAVPLPSVPISSAPNEDNARVSHRDLAFEDMHELSGSIDVRQGMPAAATLFPKASDWVGSSRATAIAGLSRIVGMECPGLHSIFSSLSVNFVESSLSQLNYRVTSVDERFRFVQQEVSGCGVQAEIGALVRQPPVQQQPIREISSFVRHGEFNHTRALIIGASRGLGEFTAKAIAAGGGKVTATYSVGGYECHRLAEEIVAFGGKCDVLPYDARRAPHEQLGDFEEAPTSLYYFATPRIFQRQQSLFDRRLYQEFSEIYITAFYGLIAYFRERHPAQKLSVFYPSSIAVESRPADLTAYAMAKAAAEILCQDLGCYQDGVRVLAPRLPRLSTDQTATVAHVETESVLDVMLPLIREVEQQIE